jgi:hypothetical protein
MSGADCRPSAVEQLNDRRSGRCPRSWARRSGVAVSVALVALAGASAALGADQQVNHERIVESFVEPDFCGTGQDINIAVDIRLTQWFAPHRADYKETATGKATFTNPSTGDVVLNRFAGQTSVVNVSGDPEGDHVQDVTVKGVPELIKPLRGGVLSRDAGQVVLRQTIEGGEVVDNEILVNKGPHPDLESDFELFCQVMTPALGL